MRVEQIPSGALERVVNWPDADMCGIGRATVGAHRDDVAQAHLEVPPNDLVQADLHVTEPIVRERDAHSVLAFVDDRLGDVKIRLNE